MTRQSHFPCRLQQKKRNERWKRQQGGQKVKTSSTIRRQRAVRTLEAGGRPSAISNNLSPLRVSRFRESMYSFKAGKEGRLDGYTGRESVLTGL